MDRYQSLIGEYVLCIKSHELAGIIRAIKGEKYLFKYTDGIDVNYIDKYGGLKWCTISVFDVDNHIRTQKIKTLLSY